MFEWIPFLLVAFLAELVGTIAGFGSSTILLPLALFFFPFQTSLAIVAIFHVFGNLARLNFFRKGFDKKLFVFFGLPSIAATILGALLVPIINQPVLKLLLGTFLILFALNSFFNPKFAIKKNNSNAIIGGISSGFLAGLIGTGGALRSAFLNWMNVKKVSYIATAAGIAVIVDLTRIPVYISQGFLPENLFPLIALLLPISIIGTFIGKKLVDKIPQEYFKKVVLIAISLAALKFIADYFIT